jgi:L,D-peptidoglycan transpeptidase YkuD (ErfK/YbiS/YcfS/YnhG family)
MLIDVTDGGPGAAPHHGRLTVAGRTVDCALGRSGIARAKREGDGATPAGIFPLREVLYRADRGPAPATRLPCRAIAEDDGWCDDPAAAAYNRPVRFPFAARAERLWRTDALYDLVIVIGHNDAPPVPGAGSAIFLHVAGDGLAATEGCVALPAGELRALVARLAPGDRIAIHDDE